MFVTGITFGQALPPGVPSNFVETPAGYFHPTCIMQLQPGERLVGNTIVSPVRGTLQVAPCQYPSYPRRVVAPLPPPPTINGWVADEDSASVGNVNWISAAWTVPNNPNSIGSQTVYFFPGLEHTPSGASILQPVLAWNGSDAAGANWVIYSWNCCPVNYVWHSQPLAVNPGEAISGLVSGTNCNAGTGVCQNWQVQTTVTRGVTSLSTTLDTDSVGQTLNWEAGGALEVYNVDVCNQLPANGAISFNDIVVRDINGGQVFPSWNAYRPTLSPDCVTGVSATTNTVSITWNGCVPQCYPYQCGQSDGCGGQCFTCPGYPYHCCDLLCTTEACQ